MTRPFLAILLVASVFAGCGENDIQEIQTSFNELTKDAKAAEDVVRPKKVLKREVAPEFANSIEKIVIEGIGQLDNQYYVTARPEPGSTRERYRQWAFESASYRTIQPKVTPEGEYTLQLSLNSSGRVSPFLDTITQAKAFRLDDESQRFNQPYLVAFKVVDGRWEIIRRQWILPGGKVRRDVEDETIHADFLGWLFDEALAAQEVVAQGEPDGSKGPGSDIEDEG